MTDEPTYEVTVRGLTRAELDKRARYTTATTGGAIQFHVAAREWLEENPPLIPVTVMLTRAEAEEVLRWEGGAIDRKFVAAAKAALAEQDES